MLQIDNRKLAMTGDKPTQTGRRTKADRMRADLALRLTSPKRTFIDGRRQLGAVDHITSLPSENEYIHLIVDGRYEPCDLVPAVRKLADPVTISTLDVVTLSFNPDNLACLCRGLDQQKIGQVRLITSNYFERAERALFELATEELGKRGSSIHGLRVHAKLMLFGMSDGRSFVIEGSGNLRSCKSIEQFVLTNSRDLLTFHRGWIEDALKAEAGR